MAVEIAWGAVVSAPFKSKVIAICKTLGVDPSFLMAAMAFETGERFTASVKNKMSGATGLIQFMPKTAQSLGTTTSALANMTEVQQLAYVQAYFSPYAGKLHTLSDVYMAILWPKAVGKAEAYVLFAAPSKAYQQNKGLDANKDDTVTKGEAVAKVFTKLSKGLGAGYRG